MLSEVIQLGMGPMDNLVYILVDKTTNTCVVVDPAWDVPRIISTIEREALSITAILLTHGHHDHVNGLDQMLAYADVPLYLSDKMPPHLTPKVKAQIIRFKDGDTIPLGSRAITCMQTPGHSPGGTCFLLDYHLITGDTLFINGCGRCNFESSDVDAMWDSLCRIKALSDNYVVYPGHDYAGRSHDTLANVKTYNRFLTCTTHKEFVRKRMGTGK